MSCGMMGQVREEGRYFTLECGVKKFLLNPFSHAHPTETPCQINLVLSGEYIFE